MTLSLWAAACSSGPVVSPNSADPAIESAGATLQLSIGEVSGDSVDVLIGYHRRPEQVGPRAVEILLGTTGNLTLISSEALAAANAADKQLVVQQRESQLRVVLFSTMSLVALDSGPLAKLRLRVAQGASTTLSVDNVGSTFAPAEANVGFVPPEPLTIGGN